MQTFVLLPMKKLLFFGLSVMTSYGICAFSSAPSPKRQPSSILERSKGIVYRTGVYDPNEYSIIANEVTLLSLQDEMASSVAQNRLGIALSPQHSIVQLLQDEANSLTRLVGKVTGGDYVLSNKIPVEIRSYEKVGACMAWHVDDVLYDPPQIEIVYTVENTSDCQTRWRINNVEYSQETDPNSVLLLKAGVALHCVTSLKRGKRVILKCAFVDSLATWLGNDDEVQQFRSSSKTSRRADKTKKR